MSATDTTRASTAAHADDHAPRHRATAGVPQGPADECAEPTPKNVVRRSLELAADRRLSEAVAELDRLEDPTELVVAIEQLTTACASVLRLVPSRTRFPIPVDYVTERFEVPTDADVGMCFALLQRAGLRAAGFDVDVEELVEVHGHRTVLLGAFHSTDAVVQFLGARWWRSPRSILDAIPA